MNTVHRRVTTYAVTMLLSLFTPGRAQDYIPGPFTDPSSLMRSFQSTFQADLWTNVWNTPIQVTQTSRVSTTFRPSLEVRQRNLAQFVTRTRTADPQGAAQLEQLFTSTDIIGEIGKALAPYGLKTNDVADAMAVYVVTAWYGVRGRDDDPTRAQLTAVRGQMANATGSVPQFAAATDAQKQELAEAMLIQAALVGQAVTAAKGQPALLEGVKKAVAQGASATFNFDLRTLRLTDQGLRRP